MYNSQLDEIVYFNSLVRNERVEFICSKLREIGCEFQLQNFESSFCKGTNIVVFQTTELLSPVTLLTSHYDGETFYDNNCGVLSLLEITGKIYKNRPNKNFVIVFTDQEEQFQQGSYFFLKNNSDLVIESNINIDGFGIGENIYSTDSLPLEKSSMLFQTDSTYFRNEKIKSTSIFSSFESEIEKAKREDVHEVFKDYVNSDFFIQKFNKDNYHKLIGKLWHFVYSPQ